MGCQLKISENESNHFKIQNSKKITYLIKESAN